jgi:hypothetical protein
VPQAPGGYVSIRHGDSDVLVNYGLWTMLAGLLSTLTPVIPIQGAGWDSFIAYQPWAGIVIAVSGLVMMIVYQSGPDFARGPGAPVLVAAFWILGITLAVFSGWIGDRVRDREDLAKIAEATAPPVKQVSPPLERFQAKDPPPQQQAPVAPPNAGGDSTGGTSAGNDKKQEPAKAAATKTPKGPFGIPTEDEKKKEEGGGGGNNRIRDFETVKKDLSSTDVKVLLSALEEIQWHYQRHQREDVGALLAKLLSNADEDVVLATLKAYKTWGDVKNIAAVIPLASHDSTEIRTAAIGLLGTFREPKGLDALVAALEKDTAVAKEALLRAGKGAEAALIKGLKHPAKVVKLECLRIIDALGLKKAQGDARRMAEFEMDGEVKAEARRVADSLAKKKA